MDVSGANLSISYSFMILVSDFPLWFYTLGSKRLKTFGSRVNCPLNAKRVVAEVSITIKISLGYRDGVLLEVDIVAAW